MSMRFMFLSLVMMFILAGCGGGGGSSSSATQESVVGSETVSNGGAVDTVPGVLPVEVPANPVVDVPTTPPVTAPENPPAANVAKEIVLAWNESLGEGGQPDQNVIGYKIHYGNASGQYSSVVTVNKATSATINLIPGGYYFALTAFDAAGNESGYSEEISATL